MYPGVGQGHESHLLALLCSDLGPALILGIPFEEESRFLIITEVTYLNEGNKDNEKRRRTAGIVISVVLSVPFLR
ncbi:hypothetical protein KQX54_020777 [Cotesia glomerata]|uniref:Uncharacterized protein n=1 Tax=Cotesia glomerata TaxID=32391 RepID=A0AAV7HMA5_COTGL|nr:hypothetical protein KQX54_020777 [Cotesia glomerata]